MDPLYLVGIDHVLEVKDADRDGVVDTPHDGPTSDEEQLMAFVDKALPELHGHGTQRVAHPSSGK